MVSLFKQKACAYIVASIDIRALFKARNHFLDVSVRREYNHLLKKHRQFLIFDRNVGANMISEKELTQPDKNEGKRKKHLVLSRAAARQQLHPLQRHWQDSQTLHLLYHNLVHT